MNLLSFCYVRMLTTNILQTFISGGCKAMSKNIQLGFVAFDKYPLNGL